MFRINPKNLNLIINVILSISSIATLGSGWSDFQNLTIYKNDTGLNNQPESFQIQREFDRKVKTTGKPVAVITQAQPVTKILLSVSGIILSIASIGAITYKENRQDLDEYIEDKDIQLLKIAKDVEVASVVNMIQEKVLIRSVEMQEELFKNPIYMALKQEQQALSEGRIQYEEPQEDDTGEGYNPYDWGLTQVGDSDKKEKSEIKHTDFLSVEKVKKIYEQHRLDGLSLKQAFQTEGYNPTNANWSEIKKEFIFKLSELKKSGEVQ